MNESEKMIALQVEHITKDLSKSLSTEQLVTDIRTAVNEMVVSMNRDAFESMRDSISEAVSMLNVRYSEELKRVYQKALYAIQENATISVETARAAVDEVTPYLPEEAAEAIEEKIQSAKQSESRISWKTVMEIITFIICILGFVKECLPDEHQQRQEAANTTVIANQEEMLDLQKQEFRRSEEFRQRAEEHLEITEEVYERIAQALEMLTDQSIESDQESQKLTNLVDLSDDSPEEKTLNEVGDTKD